MLLAPAHVRRFSRCICRTTTLDEPSNKSLIQRPAKPGIGLSGVATPATGATREA
jgi:hypothetical protein